MPLKTLPLSAPPTRRALALCGALLLLGLSFGIADGTAAARQARVSRARQAVTRLRERAAGWVRNNRVARRVYQRGRFLSFQESQPDRREVEAGVERHDERLDWFLLQRTYPTPFFNLPPLMRSLAQRQAMLRGQFEKALQPPTVEPTPYWNPLGSLTIQSFAPALGISAGRVTAVAISPADPNVILVGSGGGGIWRSDNGGAKFIPVSDKQTELAIGSIAFSESNPEVVYAGMGDRIAGYMGTGVLKSEDGGKSWMKVSGDNLPPSTVTKVLVSPTSDKRVYMAEYMFRDPTHSGKVREGGFRFSEDGGEHWSEAVVRGLPRDLVLHPKAPDTLYLSLVNHREPADPPAAVFKSRDGGKTWAPILDPAVLGLPGDTFDFKLGVTPAAPDLLYVAVTCVDTSVDPVRTRIELMMSEDGGDSWKKPSVPITREDIVGKIVEYLAVDPRDPRTIYLGSQDLFKSTDGGASWVNLSNNYRFREDGTLEFFEHGALTHVDQRDFAFSRADPKVIYVANDGGLWRSDSGGLPDGGPAFRPLNQTLSVEQLLCITTHPLLDDTVYAGTQDNGALILSPADGGWRQFIGGDSGNVVLDVNDGKPDLSFVNFTAGNINRYMNASVFTQANVANDTEFFEEKRHRVGFFPPFVRVPPKGPFYFGTWRLFKSLDADNWSLVSPKDEDILTKGYDEEFGFDVLSAVGVSPSRAGVIYTGSAHGKVMMTEDDGAHWKEITGTLPNRFVKSITVKPDDPRTVYVTFSGFGPGHVFKTTDAGASWAELGGCPTLPSQAGWCLPNVPVNALLLDPADDNTIYVGTDAGVYRTTTGGALWHLFNEGLPPVVVTDFAVTRGGRILLATYGRGAYELVRP